MDRKEKRTFGDSFAEFIQKNRKGILVTVSVLVAIFIGVIVYFAVGETISKNAIAEVEEFSTRFADLNAVIVEGEESDEADRLLADLKTYVGEGTTSFLTPGGKAFAISRAWSLIGRIYSGRKIWAEAETAWVNAAKSGNRTYLAPIAFFEAAVAAEEQGGVDRAIEYLNRSVSHPFDFPAAARAQFSIGRLYETQGSLEEALEAYRAVLINQPNMPVFQQLARSRIIKIEGLNGNIER